MIPRLDSSLQVVDFGVSLLQEHADYTVRGERGKLHKQFETRLFNSVIKGWMQIAIVEVVSVKGDKVKFRVIEETSEVVIDGKKKNQFAQGNRVQFIKYEYAEPQTDSVFYSSGKLKAYGMKVCSIS